jgi:thiopurine S-methyltransferase
VSEPWLERWEQGRIGWHEADGNSKLRAYWPDLADGSRVLVPFCGKSPDLLWLANRGLDVVGIELSRIAVESFFAEQGLQFDVRDEGALECYRARNNSITVYCGDYFAFEAAPFDALFDRGALVAQPADDRPPYVAHCKSLLRQDAYRLIITLEYDQTAASGPPFAVMPDEINSYWNDLEVVGQDNDIDNGPPKFREAGLTEIFETAWSSPL